MPPRWQGSRKSFRPSSAGRWRPLLKRTGSMRKRLTLLRLVLISMALFALLLSVSGCAMPSRQFVIEGKSAQIPESLLGPCSDLSALPDRPLSTSELRDDWTKLNIAYADCRQGKSDLIEAVRIIQPKGE